MPAAFDRMVSKIWNSMKGKKNPRTGKPFIESDAYAIATATWKKAHGGSAPGREAVKDWRILEFIMPILETRTVGQDLMVTGMAINETTTRNGIKYTVDELENAAVSFRSKPILLDHENKVKNIVGRTTENVNYSHTKRGIEFEARIVDEIIKQKINQGLITDVSIGASVTDLVEEEDGSRRAVGLEGMEISFVAIPGDPNANLAQAMENSFMVREKLQMADELSEDFIDDLELDDEYDKKQLSIKLKGGSKMAEEEQKQEEIESPKEDEKKEEAAEEKVNKTEINVDMSAVTEAIKSLREDIADLKKVKEDEEEKSEPEEKPAEEKKPVEEPSDETKGEVGSEKEKDEPEMAEEGYVVEQAETGKGFAIWRDYNKSPEKFKRLTR